MLLIAREYKVDFSKIVACFNDQVRLAPGCFRNKGSFPFCQKVYLLYRVILLVNVVVSIDTERLEKRTDECYEIGWLVLKEVHLFDDLLVHDKC